MAPESDNLASGNGHVKRRGMGGKSGLHVNQLGLLHFHYHVSQLGLLRYIPTSRVAALPAMEVAY